jgi:DNA-binding response OmpR family regulator
MKASSRAIGGAPERVTVLSVSPIQEDHLDLERIFNDFVWDSCTQSSRQVSRATNLSSALTMLRQVRYPVVLCERELPLGDWKDLLEHSARLTNPPLVIVTSLHADEHFWAEALNLGAHDVLAKPFYPPEVIRVVTLAYLRWYRDRRYATPNTTLTQAAGAE